MWRFLLLPLIISPLLAPVRASGQTNADDYFHKGAQYYIYGEKTNAVKAIYSGLRMYPADVKLNEVAKLLAKKDPEDQNKSKDSKQNQQQQKEDQDKKEQSKGQKSDQQKQNSQPQPGDKKDQSKDQKKSDADKKKEAQKAKPEESDDRSKEDAEKEAEKEAAMMAAGEMTPTQAKQLLDAAKDEDQILKIVPPNKQNRPPGSYKDW